MHLFKWEARRAGGRITINGQTNDGKAAKIVGVDKITPAAGHGMCHALDKHGERHTLAV